MQPDTADFDAFYQASARRVVLYLYAVCGDLADAHCRCALDVGGVNRSRW